MYVVCRKIECLYVQRKRDRVYRKNQKVIERVCMSIEIEGVYHTPSISIDIYTLSTQCREKG